MAQGIISLTQKELDEIKNQVRREERARAAKIIKDWYIKANHVVTKIQVKERKIAIAAAIMGDGCQTTISEE